MMEVTTLDLLVIGAYLLVILGVGVWFVRRIKNTDDYYVAGRTLGPVVLAATVCATIIGGSAMMGAWGLLAFLKATDTRENASFATSMHQRRRLRTEAQRRAEPVGDPFAQSAPGEEDAHEED